MTIRSRGKGYQVDVRVGKRRERRTARTKEAAEILEAELKVAMLAGRKLPSGVSAREAVTLEQVVEEVWRGRWRDTKGAKTAWLNISCAVNYFGTKFPVAELSVSHLTDYAEDLALTGNSNGTINRKMSALSVVLRHAKDSGALESVPRLRRKPEPKGRIRYLSPEEEAKVLGVFMYWDNQPMHDFVVLAIDTGMRLSEALGLAWRDVDFEHQAISLWETKSDLARTIPMTKRVYALLTARSARGVEPAAACLTRHSARHQWDRMRAHISMDGDSQFVIHTLRHTFASRLLQKGAGLAEVQELLGHADITTTRRYAHLCIRNLTDAVSLLDTPQLHGTATGRIYPGRTQFEEVDRPIPEHIIPVTKTVTKGADTAPKL